MRFLELSKRAILFASLVVGGCDQDALRKPSPAASASRGPAVLSPELQAKPVATVGKRVISLGDFAASVDRMDQFERMRYQSLSAASSCWTR